MAFGFEFAATIVACVAGGNYLDERIGTSPLLMVSFTLAGMVGAVYRLVRSLDSFEKRP